MSKLTCALLRGSTDRILLFAPIDDSTLAVDLQIGIKKQADGFITCPASKLKLYITKHDDGWLTRDALASLALDHLRQAKYETLTGFDQVASAVGVVIQGLPEKPEYIHVVVEVAADNDTEKDSRPTKKSRGSLLPTCRSFLSRGVHVPTESIKAFKSITTELATATKPPLLLLYGPRQFGKTTIATDVVRWLLENPTGVQGARDDHHLIIRYECRHPDVQNETMLWATLGRYVVGKSDCQDEASFVTLAMQHHDTLFLVVDDMHQLFEYPRVAKLLFETLDRWARKATFFAGFLGVGNQDLSVCHRKHTERVRGGNLWQMHQVCAFTMSQMRQVFDESPYTFEGPLQDAIIQQSAGAPGLFTALVQLTIECEKEQLSVKEWKQWVKKGDSVAVGGSVVRRLYRATMGLHDDLKTLSESEWDAVKQVLRKDGSKNVRKVKANKPPNDLRRLLRMRILTMANDGTVAVVSPIVRQIIKEYLAERKLKTCISRA